MFGDIEEDVLLTWMIDFQGVVARKNFLSCSAKLIALKWNWALWDAGCDFSWFCTGVYFGRDPDLEVQPGRQGCILLPCLGKAQLAGVVYPWRYWGVFLMALGRLCFLDGCPPSTELQLWLRLQRTLRSPHSCPTPIMDCTKRILSLVHNKYKYKDKDKYTHTELKIRCRVGHPSRTWMKSNRRRGNRETSKSININTGLLGTKTIT